MCVDIHEIIGLEYFPAFLSESEQRDLLFVIDSQPWLNDLKRRVQHYGYKYDYRARKIDRSMHLGDLPDFAVQIANEMLSLNMIDEIPDQVIVNEYLPGQGISAHVDCEPCFKDTIVTISLGSIYTMDFYSKDSDTVRSIDLEIGSALVMRGQARLDWKHGIKARKSDNGRSRKRRVSLTYRNVIVDSL